MRNKLNKKMTAFLRNTFSLLLGIYFLLAGTGFNIVNYCCDSCETKGIEFIAKHSCDEVHHHKSDCCESHSSASADSHQDIACADVQHLPDGCHILRVKVETPTVVSIPELLSVTIFTHTLFACESIFMDFQPENSFQYSTPPPDIPLPSGRDILTAKSVLLI